MKLYGLQFEGCWLCVKDTKKDMRRYQLELVRDPFDVPWLTTSHRMADEIAHHQGVGTPNSPAMPGEFYMKIPKIVELEI